MPEEEGIAMNFKLDALINAFNQLGDALCSAFENVFKLFAPGLPGNQEVYAVESPANIYKPLKLDIQFFAASGEGDGEGDGDGDDDTGAPKDLKEAFKLYPHLKTEHKQKITAAIQERFGTYDFDPDVAKAAIAKVKQLDEAGGNKQEAENAELATAKSKADKLAQRVKGLQLALLAQEDGFDPKLVMRLASDKVEALKLDDNNTVSDDALTEIIDDLREEFPTVFTAAAAADEGEEGAAQGTTPPPVKKVAQINPGTGKLNNPPKGQTEEEIRSHMAQFLKGKKKTASTNDS